MNLVDRAKNIVLAPKTEWPRVEAEPSTIRDIYTGYVVPLALVPVIAGFIGMSLIGVAVPGVGTVRTGLFAGLAGAVLQFILSLALVYGMALVVDALAPTFGGRQDMLSAFKVSAYSLTPTWLAGIFAVIPAISFLSLLGLYGIYLLYLGLPRLMRAPENRAIGYTSVVILAAIVLSIVLAGVLGVLLGRSIDL